MFASGIGNRFGRVFRFTLLLLCTTPVMAQDEVLVWTGGIGVEERNSAPKDGTKLVFFIAGGNFISDVHVVVRNLDGRELVNAVSTGPWMILKLEPGTYSVLATVGNEAQGGRITVTGGSQEFAYMFRAQ